MKPITWVLDDLFSSSLGGWDAIVEVTVCYEEPDKDVGYRGGWCVEGWDVETFVEYDGHGNNVRTLSQEQMEDHDALLCDYLLDLIDKRIKNEDYRIFDKAAENEADEREYAAEMRWERRQEEMYMHNS